MADNIIKGRKGEEATAGLYTAKGYEIIDKNWRYKNFGEIDIIAVDHQKETLVFCEVKTRSDPGFASPSLAVNNRKQQKIKKMAEIYLLYNRKYSEMFIRFDVAEVYFNGDIPKINLIESAF